ncbi:hypothetical protein M422DRAFT_184543 [Sphaerobolus stellatus SS14]|uniref:RRM domain-containing protein n=1 Tax=Sphaerobolus stellatus (strain SS14) TaxID=990650 RepID=A0A0C9UCE2_SPHS4|nr:hypothetical protein M422DRAFT_184543 [Sphaerobolus stellatus SS14]
MSRPITRPATTLPRTASYTVNTQTRVLDTEAGRILCLADIRGRISTLNELAEETKANAIIHTGDFGFFESSSLDRINDRTLRHLIQYSPLIAPAQRNSLLQQETTTASIRNAVVSSPTHLLSEFPLLLSGTIKLSVPVYTVWGACEDVAIIEKFRAGQYEIPNLNILDEATTRCIDVGGIKLRLFGLGGALVPHKLFDNGEGEATIAGGSGVMWTTALQIGELIDTAQRVFDQTETRLLVTHAAPGREGLIAQLALILKADLTISAGLHFRYASSYNEFSVQNDLDGFRRKLLTGKDSFDKVWENVKPQVEAVIDENQRILLDKVLALIERIPATGPSHGQSVGEESSWKNCWNWNLCDAANGHLVLDIKGGRVSAELKSQGFNYAYRRTVTPTTSAPTPHSVTSALPQQQQTKPTTPVPGAISQSNGTPINVATSPAPPSQPESVNGSVRAANGTPPGSDTARDRQQAKKQQRREKEKERKKEDKDAEADKQHQPKASTSSAVPSQDQETATPFSPTDSNNGARTPTGTRPKRQHHPWTLFIKLPGPCTDMDIREFFQDAKDGITAIKFPNSHFGRARVAFIEFGDEEAMKGGLAKHAEKLKDQVINVTIADERERERPSDRGGFGGRGGGRGGRGGGFAQRAAAQAGLVRPSSRNAPRRTENGDANNKLAGSNDGPAPAPKES